MARLIVATALVAMLGMPLLAMFSGEASAQQRATCSQARAHCGTQKVCQRRFESCMETGCWTVGLVKRCGYEKQYRAHLLPRSPLRAAWTKKNPRHARVGGSLRPRLASSRDSRPFVDRARDGHFDRRLPALSLR